MLLCCGIGDCPRLHIFTLQDAGNGDAREITFDYRHKSGCFRFLFSIKKWRINI